MFTSRDSRILTWSARSVILRVLSPEGQAIEFKHDLLVKGALLSANETRLLTWTGGPFTTTKTAAAYLWDIDTATRVAIFKHDDDVIGAGFSRDEARLLTWSQDHSARLWDVATATQLCKVDHENWVAGAKFDHDETHFLTWSQDKTAKLVEIAKPDSPLTFQHVGMLNGADFNSDDSTVLTWTGGGEAVLWDVNNPQRRRSFWHDRSVAGARFNSDETTLLTWGFDGTAREWDLTRPEMLQSFEHAGPVNGALFNSDGSHVLSWSDDETVKVWDITKREPVQIFRNHGKVAGVRYSPTEAFILTWGDDDTAKLWEVGKAEPIQIFSHDRIVGGTFSRDGSHVLTWGKNSEARWWSVTNPDAVRTFVHRDQINGALLSPDERLAMTWSNDGTVRLWNVEGPEPAQNAKSIPLLDLVWDIKKPSAVRTFRHNQAVSGAIFSTDGSQILSWSNYDDWLSSARGTGETRLWNVTRDQKLPRRDSLVRIFRHPEEAGFETDGGTVNGAQFDSRESRVLTWSDDRTVRLWDINNPDSCQIFRSDRGVSGATISRDDSRILAFSMLGTWLWDVTTNEVLQEFGDYDTIGAVFSNDETRVLTWGGEDAATRGRAELWYSRKNSPLQTFMHENVVGGARFNTDESVVLSWSLDGTTKLWDIQDRLRMLTPRERVLELEVRSGRALDANLQLRTLPIDEWQTKSISTEYRKIVKKQSEVPK